LPARFRPRRAIVTIGLAIAVRLGAGIPTAGAAPVNSSHRDVVWGNCDEIVQCSDAQLDEWKARGVVGFVCMHGHLKDMGRDQEFTGNAQAGLNAANYQFERKLRDLAVRRAQGLPSAPHDRPDNGPEVTAR
jgi:hypothetical protein